MLGGYVPILQKIICEVSTGRHGETMVSFLTEKVKRPGLQRIANLSDEQDLRGSEAELMEDRHMWLPRATFVACVHVSAN